jgi:ABC-type Na+ efflux pump permease subunit
VLRLLALRRRPVRDRRDPLYLASFVGYFLAGYLLYAAVLVAIGSVCNSLKEPRTCCSR